MLTPIIDTYLCLFTFAVRGSLSALVTAADDTASFLNSTLATIERNIVADAATAQNTIIAEVQKIASGIGGIFGQNITIPPIELPSVSQLSTITIPDTVTKSLQTLNNSMPTFDEVKNATDSVISFPFDSLKVLFPLPLDFSFVLRTQQNIRSTFDNFTFNSSLLPVPAKENLQFCSNNTSLDDFFQDLINSVHRVLIILAIIILLAALLAMIPNAILEWWSWRKIKVHAKIAEDAHYSMEKPDFLEIVQILASPIIYKLSTMASSKSSSQKKKILVRWFFAYATHSPALLVLAISMAMFVSCLFQIALLNEVRKAAPALVTDVDNLQALISSKIQNSSALWIDGTNKQISDTEFQINDNLLGWARESTQSLNDTLNTCMHLVLMMLTLEVVNTTVTTIKSVFGNTPLEDPILDVLNCVVLMKIESVQNGLTFVNEHAKVQFPRVDNSSLAVLESNGSGQSPSETASSSLLSIMNTVIDKWAAAIRQQAVLGGILLALYGVVVLIGAVRVSWALRKDDKTRGEGGGLSGLRANGIAWMRNRVRGNPVNPFEDPGFVQEPGPTPSGRSKE